MTSPAPAGRRWFRFSLRTLFVVLSATLIGLGLGLFVDRTFDSPTQHWYVVFLCGPWLRISVLPGHVMLEKLPGVVYQNNLVISITAITYGLYACLFVARPRWSTVLWLVAMHGLNLAIFANQYWY